MDAKTSYREATIRGATPLQLVICLYEQAIADLRNAIVALESGDIEARTRGINHALTVINHLQRTLDMERGGEVARNLARFYGVLRTALVDAHRRQSRAMVEEQITLLMEVHQAWCVVERSTAAPEAGESESAARAGSDSSFFSERSPSERSASERSTSEWNA